MSTLEKNINAIQQKLISFVPGSRNYIKYSDRLKKKVEQYLRYKETRTREESLKIKDLLSNGTNINLDGYKLTEVQ